MNDDDENHDSDNNVNYNDGNKDNYCSQHRCIE